MQRTRKIFFALPRHKAIRNAIQNALANTANIELGKFVATRDICDAEVVIADTPTINLDLTTLPQNVRYLQLIDCGSGEPHASNDNITVANASSILAKNAANHAVQQWQELRNLDDPSGSIHSSPFFAEKGGIKGASKQPQQTPTPPTVAGIIGFGTLGYEIGKLLSQLDAQIWINDIRTPRQQSFQQIGARRSSLDMLLSTSHVIFITIHPGPTSKPLLTHRELRLLTTNSTIINLSSHQVIDKTAIQTLNTHQDRAINYHEITPKHKSPETQPEIQTITPYILDNLDNYALNRQPRSIVEHVTHPKAGDPAFWASKMHPRQTPV